jgi:hypothetical protein
MTKKTRRVEMDVPKESVVVVYTGVELNMVKTIVDLFLSQSDEVWKFIGITSRKQEKILTKKLIEMENIFLENFDEGFIFRQMKEGNLEFPYQQVERNL